LRQAHQDPKSLQLAKPVDLDSAFLDTTCLKANIHYPTDWVLFRDASRTLLKAIDLIRHQGLRHRMPEPALLMRAINRLCIEMTHVPRKTDSKRHRKKVLRKMDKLLASVARHAKRYRQILDQQWEKTQWTQAQAAQVLRRLDNVLQQLPTVRKQARQRIIQEQPVENAEKILSLYEPAVNVVVRRKAGVEVEFGNTLLLAESVQGLILDHELFEKSAPADSRMIKPSLERIEQKLQIHLKHVTADRGFDSAANDQKLAKTKTYNGIAPRDPRALKKRMRSWKFAKLQRRRSQTEGRISVIIRNFLGSPMRCKGFGHRQLALGWGVLTHNLWVLARLPKRKVRKKPAPASRLAA
jgi:IS5 family transposase